MTTNERTIMDVHRITLTVMVNLDPVPGAFHTRASAEETIQAILLSTIGHYEPVVTS